VKWSHLESLHTASSFDFHSTCRLYWYYSRLGWFIKCERLRLSEPSQIRPDALPVSQRTALWYWRVVTCRAGF